jgi:inosine-uridine nucleoside N-ribohydrolase
MRSGRCILVAEILLDTDIGTDIDDAFALAFAALHPGFELLAVTTSSGDTTARARLAGKLLSTQGVSVPFGVGEPSRAKLTHGEWAADWHFPTPPHPDAAQLIIDTIRHHPEVHLVAIGPLTNVAAALHRDPVVFKSLKRLVMMGGCVRRWFNNVPAAMPEYNIALDISAARAVFGSGVPITMVGLDVTQHLHLKRLMIDQLATSRHPVTRAAVTLLTHYFLTQPQVAAGLQKAIMFDSMALAAIIAPQILRVQRGRVTLTRRGVTRLQPAPRNNHGHVLACLEVDTPSFWDLFMRTLV